MAEKVKKKVAVLRRPLHLVLAPAWWPVLPVPEGIFTSWEE